MLLNGESLSHQACFYLLYLYYSDDRKNVRNADETPNSSKQQRTLRVPLERKKNRHVSSSINRSEDYQMHRLFYRRRCGQTLAMGGLTVATNCRPSQQRKQIGSEWSLPSQGLSTRKRSGFAYTYQLAGQESNYRCINPPIGSPTARKHNGTRKWRLGASLVIREVQVVSRTSRPFCAFRRREAGSVRWIIGI